MLHPSRAAIMLHSFRAAFLQNPHRAASAPPLFNRRGATSAAVLFTLTSATALAVSSDSSNHESSSAQSTSSSTKASLLGSNSRKWTTPTLSATANSIMSSFNVTTTECEEATTPETTTTIPNYLLKFDHYNGVIVHLDWIFHNPNATDADQKQQKYLEGLYHEWREHPENFEKVLKQSLQEWKSEGRKGIWIHTPKDMSAVVPACVGLGFDFHSCQNHDRINSGGDKGRTNLILSQWLPTNVASRLPLGPYFQAGVGCVVLHPKDPSKMLVVKELTGPAAAKNLWKMPTGLIDPEEDIAEAALRELEEETGLLGATCEGVLAFRQAHGTSAGRAASDLFFVVLLRAPDSSTVDNLKPQEHEIAAIQWMPVKDYVNQEVWLKSPVYLELNQAIVDASNNQIEGKASPVVVPHKLDVGWTGGTNTVYRSNL